jgi:hypothetical protein
MITARKFDFKNESLLSVRADFFGMKFVHIGLVLCEIANLVSLELFFNYRLSNNTSRETQW